MSVEEIKACIGSDIEVSEVGVLPGRSNRWKAEKIEGEAQEDAVPGEGEIYYDIRFSAYLKLRKERIKLLVNVEAQKGTEFAVRDYDNIRKVYSIWICMNAPDYIGNAISTYRMCKEDLIPGIPDQRETYDKMAVVMVCLNPKSKKGDPLMRMLGVLLAPGVRAKEKIQQLETEFAIPMETETIGEELNQMCNLSDYVEEIGIQKGIEQGIEQGIERGREQTLICQIEKKLAKGMTVPEIADALEETEETIRRLIDGMK